ncbi:hypothetical protein CFC21_089509 [Triticum aestivum]|uniref:KIB1-4 beta-propeller domain-containing protein n=2 Tax=Triticum aestivum TaxID=4565 RepID=A0A9R1ILV3_WHEAT|nr:uncharacterized protein LOC123134669 [Triticum aestivum]KAF7086183.1 hypothetical protein CFC21_089509 [Triticum aestivum]
MAAYHGNIAHMKRLAATALDLDGVGIPAAVARTRFLGMNALHAVSGAISMLPPFQYLVEEVNMDVNCPDDMGRTPLEHAVTRGHLSIVRYLLDHGADLHQQCSSRKGTVLHRAAENGRTEIAKYLISRGAQVNMEGDFGTSLALAAGGGYTSTVKILLEHNADPNKAKKHCFLPLCLALNNSSMACVKLLIQAGADVDGFGPCHNPLATSVEKGLTEALKCLLEAGANPNVPDTFGRLPIELAAQYGTREDVEILFNFTSPIPPVVNWSVDGIIRHVQMEIKQLQDDGFVERVLSNLKRQGDEAFKKQDYLNASVYYTQALKVDNFDTEMLKRRSLCWDRISDEENTDDLEKRYKMMFRKWSNVYCRQGAALIFLKDEVTSRAPLLFSRPPPLGSGQISIMSLSTNETSTISGPEYNDASCYHSSDGWLFMVSWMSDVEAKPYLLKPQTGQCIDLPVIPTKCVGPTVFSTISGVPDVVVCFDSKSDYPCLRIKYSHVKEWKAFEYPKKSECGVFKYGAIIGDEVYYIDVMGKVILFRLLEHNWSLLCEDGWGRKGVGRGTQFFLTAERDIVRVHCPPPCYEKFCFSKFDQSQKIWISLTENELENTSWFLSSGVSGQRCFRVRGLDGKKVYLLSPNDEKKAGNRKGANRVLRPLPAIQEGNIYVHDLDSGTTESLLSEPFMTVSQFWIHSECFQSPAAMPRRTVACGSHLDGRPSTASSSTPAEKLDPDAGTGVMLAC